MSKFNKIEITPGTGQIGFRPGVNGSPQQPETPAVPPRDPGFKPVRQVIQVPDVGTKIPYLVASAVPQLDAERIVVGGPGILITDNGPNSTFVISLTASALNPIVNQSIDVQIGGAPVGTRPTLNFTSTGLEVTGVDDSVNNRVTINLSAAAGGTVTSVAVSGGAGIDVGGSPITTAGTISISLLPTGVSAGTHNLVTVDQFGRVTSGSTVNYLTDVTLSPQGGGADLFTGVSGGELTYRTFTGGGIVEVTQVGNTINISAASTPPAVVNITVSSKGAGEEVITAIDGGDEIVQRTIVGAGGIDITSDANQITISAAPNPTLLSQLTNDVGFITGVTVSAPGGGESPLVGVSAAEITLRTFVGGGDVTVSTVGNTILVSANAGGSNNWLLGNGGDDFATAPTAGAPGSNAFAIGNNASSNGVNSFVLGTSSNVSAANSWLLGDSISVSANDSFALGNAGAIKIYGDAAGNIGLGTTNPQDRLHLKNGTVRVSAEGQWYRLPTSAGTNGQILTTGGDGSTLSWTTLTGSGISISAAGGGTELVAQVSGTEVTFRTLVAGGGIEVSATGTGAIIISAAGGATNNWIHANGGNDFPADPDSGDTGNRNIAIGDATQIGTGAQFSLAFGTSSFIGAGADRTFAIGGGTFIDTSAFRTYVIGDTAYALSNSKRSMVLGHNSSNVAEGVEDSYVLGGGSFISTSAKRSVAIGNTAYIMPRAERSFAIGDIAYIETDAQDSIAIGNIASVGIDSVESMALGYTAIVGNQNDSVTVIGPIATTSENVEDSVVIGPVANISSTTPAVVARNLAIGYSAVVFDGDDSLALGSTVTVNASNSFAIGDNISLSNDESFALGNNGTIKIYADAAGNIGIGTLVPEDTLHVSNGTIRVSSEGQWYRFPTSAGTPGQLLATNGNSGTAYWTTLTGSGVQVSALGGGESVVIGVSGDELEFRTFVGGGDVSVAVVGDTIVVSANAGSGGANNWIEGNGGDDFPDAPDSGDVGDRNFAIGHGALVAQDTERAFAIGDFANVGTSASSAFAIGRSAGIGNGSLDSFVIGRSAGTGDYSTGSFAVGRSASVSSSATNSFAVGSSALIGGDTIDSFTIGRSAGTGDDVIDSFAIGKSSYVDSNTVDSFTIGKSSSVAGNNSFVIGNSLSLTDNDSFVLGNNGTPKIFGDAAGNIGIGTITPGDTLHVKGYVRVSADGQWYLLPTSAGNAGQVLTSDGNGEVLYWSTMTGSGITVSAVGSGEDLVADVSGNEITFRTIVGTGIIEVSAQGDGSIKISARNYPVTLSALAAGSLVIESVSGNSEIKQRSIIGGGIVNVTQTSATITISAASSPGSSNNWIEGNGGNDFLNAPDSGDIGDNSFAIGDNAAVFGEDSFALGTNTTVNADNSWALGDGLSVTDDDSFALGNNGVIKIFADVSGNVGIGTITPNAKLEIFDADADDSFILLTSPTATNGTLVGISAGTDIFTIRNQDNSNIELEAAGVVIIGENSYTLPISAGTTGQFLTSNGPGGTLSWTTLTGSGISVSAAGGGTELVAQVSGDELTFRTLIGGGGIEVSANNGQIIISAAPFAQDPVTVSALGGGATAIVSVSGGTEIRQREIVGGGIIDITETGTTITISAAPGSFSQDPVTVSALGGGEELIIGISGGTEISYRTFTGGGAIDVTTVGNTINISAAIPSGATITVEESGSAISTGVDTLNFTGVGVSASVVGNTATVTLDVPQTYTFRINMNAGGNIDSVTPTQDLPAGWSSTYINPNIVELSHNVARRPKLAFYHGFTVGGNYRAIGGNGSFLYLNWTAATQTTTFRIFIQSAAQVLSEANGHVIADILF